MKCAACVILAFLGGTAALPQTTTAPSGSAGGTTTGPTGGATAPPAIGRIPVPVTPTTPTSPNNSPTQMQPPIFLSGTVITEDGSPVPANLSIQRVCGASVRAVAYTDSKGRFNFQWGQSTGVLADASESGSGLRGSGTGGGLGSSQGMGMGGNMSPSLGNCELRANAAGYGQKSIDLFSHNGLDNPNIGTILIHRLANVEGTSISATSMMAPKDAKKAYEKGLQSLLKDKNDEAAKAFEKAVDIYPKYADAWVSLGKVRLGQRAYEPAREALLKAIEVDGKLVSPYVELGYLAAQEQKWEASSKFFDRALRLDPVDFPQAWYANAVANFNLRNFEAAEKSAREAVKLDPRHVNPRADYLLGLILIEKHDYPGAATQLRAYLRQSPDAADVAAAKNHLSQLDKVLEK